ncbi:MAG: hypothetical protein HZC47_05020 [Methanobacterium sp.]|uniref:hypothetical protein n=1 Tax=Methanobacterium sp. TaxID=2164 RepID=UPI003D650D31|nr:hypothetical protein [Methanobacterium sp.]
MFGMTKKQFLKRSKKCTGETGALILLIREIMNKEIHGKTSNRETSKQIEIIRKDIESIFFEFEKLKPPSKCFPLKQRIIHVLINFQEVIVVYSEYLTASREEMEEKSQNKLKESQELLEEFRKEFHSVTGEVNSLLNQPFFKKKD